MKRILAPSVLMILFTLALGACFHETGTSVRTAYKITENNETIAHDETKEKEDTSTHLDVNAEVKVEANVQASSRYVDYSKAAFDAVVGKKRVYFFHAKWCPSCKAANAEFMGNFDKIPADVVLFKTDYDTETGLKDKYDITYQHTFVYVDGNGNEIKKWNGGGIAELIANTKS